MRQYGHPMLVGRAVSARAKSDWAGDFPDLLAGVEARARVGHSDQSCVHWSAGHPRRFVVRDWCGHYRFLDNGLEVLCSLRSRRRVAEWSLSRFKVLEQWDPAPGPDVRATACRRAAARHAQGPPDRQSRPSRARSAGTPLQVRSLCRIRDAHCLCRLGRPRTDVSVADLRNAAGMLDWAPMVDRIFPWLSLSSLRRWWTSICG